MNGLLLVQRGSRIAGIGFGLMTQVLFVLTVGCLFRFLQGTGTGKPTGALWVDVVLALQFAVPHSLLLHPAVRDRLRRWIPAEFYGCMHSTLTCGSLLLVMAHWQQCDALLWELHGWAKAVIQTGYCLWWGALVYSLWISGLGYQTGWTPWVHWVRRIPLPRRDFRPRGPYRWLRHPIYLSFLGLLWCSPCMSVDHFVLAAIWSCYILVGSHLKDERLARYLGDAYRQYQARVRGYPLVPFGPLARREVPCGQPVGIGPDAILAIHSRRAA